MLTLKSSDTECIYIYIYIYTSLCVGILRIVWLRAVCVVCVLFKILNSIKSQSIRLQYTAVFCFSC